MTTTYRFVALDDALVALHRLRAAGITEMEGPISLYKTLIHCAQSIECSLRGYPQMKPKWLRRSVGRVVPKVFFALGRMKHNLAAPVPGEPAIPADGDLDLAWERLLSAIAAFQHHQGPLHEHFLYGMLSETDYSRVHALHLADHFSAAKL